MRITVYSHRRPVKRVISVLTIPQGYGRLIPSFLNKVEKPARTKGVPDVKRVMNGRAVFATGSLSPKGNRETLRIMAGTPTTSETGVGNTRDGKRADTNCSLYNPLS